MNDAKRFLLRLRKFGIRPSLERMREALNTFGRPDQQFRIVLVAGTNGKGTCAKALADILRGHGVRTGLYLSPHLFSYEERFVIDGRRLTAGEFERETKSQREQLRAQNQALTEFEFLTLLAYRLFAKKHLDWAVVEVGMGGRWDATNSADPEMSVITSVGLDHMEFLGQTEAQIAFDKAHVARKNRPLWVGPVHPAARAAIEQVSSAVGARLTILDSSAVRPISTNDLNSHADSFFYAGRRWRCAIPPSIFGTNLALAIAAARQILRDKFRMDKAQRAVCRVRLPGRFRLKRVGGTEIFFDVAHNESAFSALFGEIARISSSSGRRNLQVVLGMQKQKQGESAILPFLTPRDSVHLVKLSHPRSKPARLWKPFIQAARSRRIFVHPPCRMILALRRAVRLAKKNGLVVATGSFHTVREAQAACER